MGIFNRKIGDQDRSQFEFEDSFTNRPEARPQQNMSTPQPPAGPNVTSKASSGNVANNRAAPKRARTGYSIEDAIQLMRELPSDQRTMVVSIVQKTLSSANISVGDIVEDAKRKLNRLNTRRSQLDKEINELEAGISERRNEIEKISTDTEETETVKVSFEAISDQREIPEPERHETNEERSQIPLDAPTG